MKRGRRKNHAAMKTMLSVSAMLGGTAMASVETIARRTALMAGGRCSGAEYRRMLQEKIEAVQESVQALARGYDVGAVRAAVAPFHRRVTANARRLRRKGT
jgi:hypothetical protein